MAYDALDLEMVTNWAENTHKEHGVSRAALGPIVREAARAVAEGDDRAFERVLDAIDRVSGALDVARMA